MIKKNIAILAITILAFFIITGCSTAVYEPASSGNNDTSGSSIKNISDSLDPILAHLESQGIDTHDYVVEGDSLIVEHGCVEFSINELKHDLEHGDRQWRHGYIISQSNVTDIKIKFDSNVPSAWKTATRYAFARWNEIHGSKIKMKEVTSGQNLTIKYATLSPSTTIARATFPSSTGNVGHTITISTNHNSLSTSKKNFTMVHEIGHCLGMRHINNSESGRIEIAGTPDTDSNSVMNPTVKEWNGFSAGDIIAAQQVYPPNGAYVTLYQHSNYTGTRYIVAKNHYVNSTELKKMGLHDNISSVKVHNSAKVRLCQHASSGGATLYVTSSISNLNDKDFNDLISSVSWSVPGGAYAVLYQHANYDGLPYTIWFDDSNFADSTDFNDKASSVRLYGGARIRLYQHSNYGGSSHYRSTNISNLNNVGFNDKASSVKFYQ